jgi:hypothetical protein
LNRAYRVTDRPFGASGRLTIFATDWAHDQLGEDRANPLFDPQPDFAADMGEPMFDASGRPAMVARDWSDPDKRAGIDERLEEQREEMEAQQRRWQEEWMR